MSAYGAQPQSNNGCSKPNSTGRWAVDSGAERVIREKELGEDLSKGVSRGMKCAGGLSCEAVEMESAEIVTKGGEPLLPLGRAVRIGKWSFLWGQNGTPCMLRLRPEHDALLQEILSQYPDAEVLRSEVHNDIPFMTDDQARVLRDSIDLTKTTGCSSKWWEKVNAKSSLLQVEEDPSLTYLGTFSKAFNEWFCNNEEGRQSLEGMKEREDFAPRLIAQVWEECKDTQCFGGMLTETFPSEEENAICEKTNDQNSKETGGVTFGGVEHCHFFMDGQEDSSEEDLCINEKDHPVSSCIAKVARKRFKKVEEAKEPTDEVWKHNLTHLPACQKCKVCSATKKQHKGFVRGSCSGPDSEQGSRFPGKNFITFDWGNPRTTASDGSKYMAVITWVRKKEDGKSPIFVRGYVQKKDNSHVALHAALQSWGILGQEFVCHSDNEGLLKCPKMLDMIRNNKGETMYGVPYSKNSNGRAERSVRTASEGVRALLCQAGLPTKCWAVACLCWSVEHARSCGISPRLNKITPYPFGCLGEAILPQGVQTKDKFDSRTVWVMCLGVAEDTTAGMRILYPAADGKLRRATIMARDADWHPDKWAVESGREDLNPHRSLMLDFVSKNQVTQQQASCDQCGKWRFVHPDMFGDSRTVEFVCRDIGMKCTQRQDKRVNDSFEFDDDDDKLDPKLDFDKRERDPQTIEVADEADDVAEEDPVSAKRCKIVTDDKGTLNAMSSILTDSDNEEMSDEMKSALLRLGSRACTKASIDELRKVASLEKKAESCHEVSVFAVVVAAKEAYRHDNPEKPQWVQSFDQEVNALMNVNGVLGLASTDQLKPGDEVLPSLAVFTKKTDGRFKCRVVACGNYQRLQAADAYAGVVGHSEWMQGVLLSLMLGQEVFQVDITTAFLQTNATDDCDGRPTTYIRPPPQAGADKKVLWRVLKSIYGLRSAPSAWKKTLTGWLKEKKFRLSFYDDSILYREDGLKVLLYVDDLVVLGERQACLKFLDELRGRFQCTDPKDLRAATAEEPLEFLGHDMYTPLTIN